MNGQSEITRDSKSEDPFILSNDLFQHEGGKIHIQ